MTNGSAGLLGRRFRSSLCFFLLTFERRLEGAFELVDVFLVAFRIDEWIRIAFLARLQDEIETATAKLVDQGRRELQAAGITPP